MVWEADISSLDKRSQTPASGAVDSNSVRSLFDRCSALEKQLNKNRFDELKTEFVRRLAFGGAIFDAFAELKHRPGMPQSEVALKYELVYKLFHVAKISDERLRVFAQWIWAELDVKPEDSLGEEVFRRLTRQVSKRVAKLPWKDFYYVQLVRIWLPYTCRLLEEGKRVRAGKTRNTEQRLKALGFQRPELELFAGDKAWRSAEEFTFEWLARRQAVRMLRPRSDPDVAATLRNAYSRVFGSGAPRKLTCIFCEKTAVGEFYGQDRTSAHCCADHGPDRLPKSRPDAWIDVAGRYWWREAGAIRFELSLGSTH